jgi:hypothetical protein
MNPFLLWVPGVALIVIGVLLLAFGTVGSHWALTLVGIGTAVESIGVLLWVRGRQARTRRP